MIWSRRCRYDPEVDAVNRLLHRMGDYQIPRLPQLTNIIEFAPIPSAGVTHSLKEACYERAEALLKQQAKPLLLFSGGVDSSLALAALAKQKGDRPLIVGVTPTAVEHTDVRFIKWLVEQGCTFQNGEHPSLKPFTQNRGFIITGALGDNLVLGDAAGFFQLKDRVWSMEVAELFEHITGRSGGDKQYHAYRHVFKHMPSDMEHTPSNLVWWMGFCFLWHRTSLLLTVSNDLGPIGECHVPFFISDPLQRWMMQDTRVRCGQSAATHKDKLIEVIWEMVGFEFHVPQKTAGWDDVFAPGPDDLISIDSSWNITRL